MRKTEGKKKMELKVEFDSAYRLLKSKKKI